MACAEFEERILRDLDGEVAPSDRSRLQEHLVQCASCQASRDAFGRIDEAVRRSTFPATPRRDFAATALEKAVAETGPTPHRGRRRISDRAWMGLALSAVGVMLGLVAALVWYGSRSPAAPPTSVPPPLSQEGWVGEAGFLPDRTASPSAEYLSPEELRKIYAFGEVDPIRELTEVNLRLSSAESLSERVRSVGRGIEALLDGFADACAYGDMVEAGDYREAIHVLVTEGWTKLCGQVEDRTEVSDLDLGFRLFHRRYGELMALARELPRARRGEVERVLASCSEGREAAREAVRRLEVP